MASECLLVCNCGESMSPDAESLGAQGPCHQLLCRQQIGHVASALETSDQVTIACAQEAPAFLDLAEELGRPEAVRFVDIRDRAGWSEEGSEAHAKMAALIAEAQLAVPNAPVMPIHSEGVCLIYGVGDVALRAAERVQDHLSVTLVLTDAEGLVPPSLSGFTIACGTIRQLSGSLGRFDVIVDDFAEAEAAGRGEWQFGERRHGGQSNCDVVIDLSGAAPLVVGHEKRDGYFRADPNDPLAVERVLFDAIQMVGEFEKPRYIRFDDTLCAHSRARKQGCTRCLSVCPTGAITPAGDTVHIDPHICAGCGSCAAICPTGAARYDDPPFTQDMLRMQTLIGAYLEAGGTSPCLLVHEADHGSEMIRLAARFGRGLPARVIPMAVYELTIMSHAHMLTALAMGFDRIVLLPSPKTERQALQDQLDLARALAADVCSGEVEGQDRIKLLDVADPDALSDQLYGMDMAALERTPVRPLGGPRESVRLSMAALCPDHDAPVPLPGGAPYGAITVDTDACTLCLACTGQCPTGALQDNPEKAQLRFVENACIQCGLCSRICPEQAITLTPQYNPADQALSAVVMHEEEPFACIECGTPFGVKSSIERIVAKLSDQHWMYTQSDNVRLIQMCSDCRVEVQFRHDESPMRLGERPRIRTTEDDLRERDETKH